MESLAEKLVFALFAYFAIGIIIAVPFLVYWVSRLDDAARGAGFLFRPIVFLGCVTVWPFILIRILSGRRINQPLEDSK